MEEKRVKSKLSNKFSKIRGNGMYILMTQLLENPLIGTLN